MSLSRGRILTSRVFFICRSNFRAGNPDLYIAVVLMSMPRDVPAYINKPSRRRKQIMRFTGPYYSTNRRRPHNIRTNPRPRSPLFCAYSRPGYPYSDDSEDCDSFFSEFSDSDSSYFSGYPIRRPADWTARFSKRVMNHIRPRKCLSSLLTADFLDLFNGRNKVTRRTRTRRNRQGYRFRGFVVDRPEDSSVEELPPQKLFARRRPTPGGTDFASTFVSQGQYHPRIGRSGVPGHQQPRVARPTRERTPVTEPVPARRGRRVSPVRWGGTRETMPPKIHRYHLSQEVDRGGIDAFRPNRMPRTTRRSNAMPRSTGAFLGEGYPRYGIPIPARENFSPSSEHSPEPPRFICRIPRPYHERWPRGPTPRSWFEDIYPRRNVRVEERWPRSDPPILKLGRSQSSTAGFRVLERARARPGAEHIMLEARIPRYW